ncbi:hypothetical protein AAF712_006958 [Marasmius tenuissimus]|uniref:Uncharacterized protein n=1 Tax=Marasmius tenuissimus TaxID=585030 RepID=A0ABR2ZWM0_9AGAR
MVTGGTSSKESTTPWFPNEPLSISQAFDSLVEQRLDEPKTAGAPQSRFFSVARRVKLEVVDFSQSNMSRIKDIWVTTADTIKHVARLSPSGPCTGTSRKNVQIDQGLLNRYFVHQFLPFAVEQHLPRNKLDALYAATGVVSFDRVKNVSDDTFITELGRFLVCLVCGTSLQTADVVLESADFRVVCTEYGKLLALLRRDVLSMDTKEDLRLIGTDVWGLQGFLVGHGTQNIQIVGRTVIPHSKFWGEMTRVMESSHTQ